jgi:hypothetical protein
MNKFFLILLLPVSACILMAQQNNNYGEFVIEIRQINQMQAAVIVGYRGTSTQITIPDRINGYPVVGIGNNAFRSRHLESVHFPSTLVFIEEYAFYDNKLLSISLPASVTNVGAGAFDNNAASGSPHPDAPASYVRTLTIKPAHGETITAQQPNSASQSVNIVVVPGYNPIRTAQQPMTTGIVTVQENKSVTPAPVSASSLPVRTSTISVYTPVQPQGSVQPQRVLQQSGQTPQGSQPLIPRQSQRVQQQGGIWLQEVQSSGGAQPQEQQGYVQRSPSENTNLLRLVPENFTMDYGTTEQPAAVQEPLKLQQSSVYPMWRIPPAR